MKIKYVVLMAIFLAVLGIRPWRFIPFSKAPASPLSKTSVDPLMSIPVHNIIYNHYSDLAETRLLDQTIERFMRKWEIHGASLAIIKSGKLIYSKGYGYADVEEEVPMGVNHIFRIASVSKLITAAGIMKLAETGQLSLDTPVFGEDGILNDSIYLDIKDKRVRNITIEHLLRHQGGFSIRYTDPMFNPVEVAQHMNVPPPADLTTIIRYILSKRLGFSPGSSTSYSNVGYGILSRVIEKVSGEPYEQFIQEHILLPAGCYDMHLGRNLCKDRFPNEVRYYEPSNAERVPLCSGEDTMVLKSNGGNNIEALYGAGGWVSSPTELLRFLLAIDGDPAYPDILSPESIEMMTCYQPNGLPIGWMNTNQQGDWRRSGTLAGSSIMMKRQKDGYSWVFVTNTSCWVGSRFPQKIEYMLYQAMGKVKNWPERDLFNPDYCLELERKNNDLAFEEHINIPYYILPSFR